MAKRASGNYLLRLSITLMVIGYGSVLLNFTEIQFTVLGWAHSMQPWIGLIIGTIGLGILVIPLIARRGGGGSVAPAQPFQQNYGYAQPPQQPYGTPGQGFPQQQSPQQQGFGQQGFAPQQGFPQQGQPQQGFPQQGFPQQAPYQAPQQQYGQQPQFPPQGYGPQQ
jgi:hypothetical protein